MSNHVQFEWSGMSDLRKALQQLPSGFTREGGTILESIGHAAAATIGAGYPEKSGELAGGMQVITKRDQFGIVVIVRNRVKYAHWYERGTAQRETKRGWKRGAVRKSPGRNFIPNMIRSRKLATRAIVEMLRRAGLVVVET